MRPPADNPPSTEGTISAVLRIGVAASLALLAAGTLLSFLQSGGYGPQASDVRRLVGSGGAFPRTSAWFLGRLGHADGQAVIVAGLLLLIATPVLRVAVSVAAFWRERDRAFVIITATVSFCCWRSPWAGPSRPV